MKDYSEKIFNSSIVNTNAIVITDTNARTEIAGYSLQVIEEAVIASITYNESTKSNTIVGVTLPVGAILFLSNITSIGLTSGKVIVYQDK